MTCTYKNTYRRPASGLAIRKVSLGRPRDVRLRDRRPGRPRHRQRDDDASWASRRGRADRAGSRDLPVGSYKVTETLPPDRWRDVAPWTPSTARRARQDRRRATAPTITVPSGPNPRVHVHQPLHAGRARSRCARSRSAARPRRGSRCGPEFGADPAGARAARRHDRAGRAGRRDGRQAQRAADRRVLDPGDDRRDRAGGTSRRCSATAFRCRPSAGGSSSSSPTATPCANCVFVNQRVPDVVPPDPAPPAPPPPDPPAEVGPQGGIAGAEAASAAANLVITKRARPRLVKARRRAPLHRSPSSTAGLTPPRR